MFDLRVIQTEQFAQIRFDGAGNFAAPLFAKLFRVREHDNAVAHARKQEVKIHVSSFRVEVMFKDKLPVAPQHERPVDEKFFQRNQQHVGNVFVEKTRPAVVIENFHVPVAFGYLQTQAHVEIESNAQIRLNRQRAHGRRFAPLGKVQRLGSI